MSGARRSQRCLALGEWLGEGRGVVVPTDATGRLHLDLRELAALLDDTPRLRAQLETARIWAESQTWSLRADEWAQLFENTEPSGARGAEAEAEWEWEGEGEGEAEAEGGHMQVEMAPHGAGSGGAIIIGNAGL